MTESAQQQQPPRPADERQPSDPRPPRPGPNLLLRGPLAAFRRPIRRQPSG